MRPHLSMIGVCSQCIASLAKCPARTNNLCGFTTSNVLTLSNRRTSSWNEGNINYFITNLLMVGLLGYKVICAKKIKTFWMLNILSEKCYCFFKISFGCLDPRKLFFWMSTDCLEAFEYIFLWFCDISRFSEHSF